MIPFKSKSQGEQFGGYSSIIASSSEQQKDYKECLHDYSPWISTRTENFDLGKKVTNRTGISRGAEQGNF